VFLLVLALTSIASGDPGYKTGEAVVLREKPGERQAVVARLPAGTKVDVDREQGRWRHVRAGGKSGWVTRTTLVGGPPPNDVGAAGKWSANVRGAATAAANTDALTIEVIAEAATLRGEPNANAPTVGDATPGARLAVLDARTQPGWIKVRDAAGLTGWIERDHVDNGDADAAFQRPLPGAAGGGDAIRPPPRGVALRGAARIGYRSLDMAYRSNGGAQFANYVLSSEATTLDLDGDALLRSHSRRLGIGFDARFRLSYSAPGIAYVEPSGMTSRIAFSMIEGDAGVRAALRVGVADVAFRTGYHYGAFLVKDVENVGKLPRERLQGLTAGSRVDVRPADSRFGISTRLDVMLVGRRAQTPGLQDGTSSTARALWFGFGVHYTLSRRMTLEATFDYERATTGWTGMATRTPGATAAHRTDTTQLIEIGLSTEL